MNLSRIFCRYKSMSVFNPGLSLTGEAISFPQRFRITLVVLRRKATPLYCHACHAGAAEAVQNHVSRLGVMQNTGHGGQVWNLGVS